MIVHASESSLFKKKQKLEAAKYYRRLCSGGTRKLSPPVPSKESRRGSVTKRPRFGKLSRAAAAFRDRVHPPSRRPAETRRPPGPGHALHVATAPTRASRGPSRPRGQKRSGESGRRGFPCAGAASRVPEVGLVAGPRGRGRAWSSALMISPTNGLNTSQSAMRESTASLGSFGQRRRRRGSGRGHGCTPAGPSARCDAARRPRRPPPHPLCHPRAP